MQCNASRKFIYIGRSSRFRHTQQTARLGQQFHQQLRDSLEPSGANGSRDWRQQSCTGPVVRTPARTPLKISPHTAERRDKSPALSLLPAARQRALCTVATPGCSPARSLLAKVRLDNSKASCRGTGQQVLRLFDRQCCHCSEVIILSSPLAITSTFKAAAGIHSCCSTRSTCNIVDIRAWSDCLGVTRHQKPIAADDKQNSCCI